MAKVAVNLLTGCRIPLSVLIYLLIVRHKFVQALMLFVLAVTTDWLDGTLARRLNVKTRFGAAFEHVSDGLMMGIIWFGFVRIGLLPLWLYVFGWIYSLITWFVPLKVKRLRSLNRAAGLRTLFYGVAIGIVAIILIFEIDEPAVRYPVLSILLLYSVCVFLWKRDRIAYYWRNFREGRLG